MSISYLYMDGRPMVESGIHSILRQSGFSTIESSDDLRTPVEFMNYVLSRAPNLVLCNIYHYCPSRIDLFDHFRELQEGAPEATLVILSDSSQPTFVARASTYGARDYLSLREPTSTLVRRLKAAHNGTIDSSSMIESMRRILQSREKVRGLNLTARETQVLRNIACGLNNKEIAKSLGGISVETVKEHVQNLLRKLNAVDRTQAAVFANKRGMVEWNC